MKRLCWLVLMPLCRKAREPWVVPGVQVHMPCFLGVGAVVALLAGGTQQGVDFSGRWVLQSSADHPEAPRVLHTNVRGEPVPPTSVRVTIRRESAAGISSETRFIGVIGGSVGPVAGEGPEKSRRTHEETQWDGEKLVFINGSYTGESPGTGESTERREVWSLTVDGALVIEISSEGSEQSLRTERFVYLRQKTGVDRRPLIFD